ncbi:splicing factor, Prp19-binding domain-containing protein [Gautieria morchelliformis]|nr:splicing factor, Prp19-binding domain-containing protein [Gautieria morchelliformis]
MQPVKKKDAPRLARPAVRYWKGKAPKGIAEAQGSDSDSDNASQGVDLTDVPIGGLDASDIEDDEEEEEEVPQQHRAQKTMNVALRNVNISKEGKVIVDGKEESGRTIMEQESEEEGSDGDLPKDAKEEAGSSEYESDSEEEDVKPAAMFRPVFVPKRARETIAVREAEALESEEAIRKRELEAEERRKQSHDMVAESIKRELAEKETEEHIPDVDDTDGLDLTAEFEAWRLRELGRIKREKEEEVRREEERAEIERRRALPEEVRLKEDLERAQKSRDEKPKGQQKFLQKYWHKGAFHQDEEILKRHDFTEATESTVDVSLLPKVMQVRDFGKRSRTKYTHLVDQDTTLGNGGFGGAGPGKPNAGQGCFLCGGPHLKKDCPQLQSQVGAPGSGANRTVFASGANGAVPAERQWGKRDGRESQSWKDRDQDDEYRSGDRGHDARYRSERERGTSRQRVDYRRRSRSKSRSRSLDRRPRRRSRSRSVDLDSRDREKRRRMG